MTIRSNTTPMLTQSGAARSMFPIEGMRLLDGEDAAAKAAREAAEAATAEAARVAAEAAATAAAAEATRVAAEAEAARIAASKLSETEAALLKENMKIKQKAKDAAEALEAANLKLKDFEGLDPAEIKTLVEAQKAAKAAAAAAEEAALVAKGDWDRLKTTMADAHKTAIEAANATVAEKDGALKSAMQVIDDLTVGAKFTTSAYIKDETVLPGQIARQVFGQHFDLVDGVVTGYDKPRGAKDRTPIVDASGDPLDFDAAMAKLIEASPDRDSLKRANIQPGGGPRTPTVKPGAGDLRTIRKSDEPGELRGAARIQAALAAGALAKKAVK
jgi:hypothetical protein